MSSVVKAVKIVKCLAISCGLFLSAVTAFADDIQTVSSVDVSRYLGTWYQIARNPVIFEAGCVCSRQVLTPTEQGDVSVVNTCNFLKPSGRVLKITGTAQSVDAASNSKFAVDFGLPWKGDYWIIALDQDYRYAVVTDRHQRSLYILSKTSTLDPALYAQAVTEASQQVDTSKLAMTLQDGCQYP